ncbi:hypothetical protein F4821DRAFT_275906 [Hypoxylon rubiginosum]|uniref:Uncharacterized protein n=1 Tax=Hypoxylon rubiginosum TaxID=110542 RepID=A0ACC0D9M3_9PEZI|nr:hypothetical protein F4821DRAFT_275906 [Hypoxylon rubiginosum]
MDGLPHEILRIIVGGLDAPLAKYASVFRNFQQAVETSTFANIRTDSTEQSEKDFDHKFASTRRRCLLRVLKYEIELPNIRLEHDIAYIKAVSSLFRRLQQWTDFSKDKNRRLSLDFVIKSPYPYTREQYIEFAEELKALPPLSFVSKFSSHSGCHVCHVHPSVIGLISKALPKIEELSWELCAVPRRLVALRAEMRASMALNLLNTDFSNLEFLDIHHDDYDPKNHDWKPENLLDANGDDPLSLAVNRVSKLPKLRRLTVWGSTALSPTVFNIDGEDSNAWRYLKFLQLDVSKTTPGGSWYFTGDRESAVANSRFDSDDSDSWGVLDGDTPLIDFRFHPDPTTLDPFLVAMVRAIVRMPTLERFICHFLGAASIEYYGPGVKVYTSDMDKRIFIDSALNHGRWIMDFDTRQSRNDQDPLPSDWVLPREIIETLKAEDHRIFLTRGFRLVAEW